MIASFIKILGQCLYVCGQVDQYLTARRARNVALGKGGGVGADSVRFKHIDYLDQT